MSDNQMAELYERIVKEKKKENAESAWPFLRGWNAAIDFVLKQMRLVCDENEDDEKAA